MWHTTRVPYWFDGNNLIGQTAARARENAEARRAFLKQLSSYSTSRGGRFLVFFDGDDPDRTIPPRGVQVHFSAPFSADDAMLEKLAGMQNAGDVIVVTNDVGLRNKCKGAGAKTMDWGKFTSVMQTSSGFPKRNPGSDTAVNVEEWIRYFGLDKDSLE